MRYSWLLLLLTPFACDDATKSPGSQPNRWDVREGVANFAVLQVDYETLAFEGGVLLQFALCDTCDADSIPLRYSVRPASDFGWSLFEYAATQDTVFYGTTVWSGRGERSVPAQLVAPDSFAFMFSRPVDPISTEYYSYYFSDDASGRAAADADIFDQRWSGSGLVLD